MRIHKSYIVNLEYIDQVEGHSILVKGKRIPIGSSYRSDFYKLIKEKGSKAEKAELLKQQKAEKAEKEKADKAERLAEKLKKAEDAKLAKE